MKGSHFFEFMDLHWIPSSLRDTIRDILEIGNGKPFRDYYQWVTAVIKRSLPGTSVRHIVELGAGSAPVTRHLVKAGLPGYVRFVVTDIHPDVDGYKTLHQANPDRVFPCLEPVDFGAEQDWPKRSLLVLSAAFHHVHPDQRAKVLENLGSSGARVMILEALNHNLVSVLFGLFGGFAVGLIAPLFMLSRPGCLRRVFWCWLLPLAPLAFGFDGAVSALRCWTKKQWLSALEGSAVDWEEPPELRQSLLYLTVLFKGKTQRVLPESWEHSGAGRLAWSIDTPDVSDAVG